MYIEQMKRTVFLAETDVSVKQALPKMAQKLNLTEQRNEIIRKSVGGENFINFHNYTSDIADRFETIFTDTFPPSDSSRR